MNAAVTSTPKLTLLAIAASLCLSACGGSDSTPVEPAKPVAQTGVFLDGAVEGLDYVAGSAAKASRLGPQALSLPPSSNKPCSPARWRSATMSWPGS